MVNFHPQFIVDENQNQRAVIVPFEEWKKIVEELEEEYGDCNIPCT
jgi:hypothetical protein